VCSVFVSGLSDSSAGRIEPTVPIYGSPAHKAKALSDWRTEGDGNTEALRNMRTLSQCVQCLSVTSVILMTVKIVDVLDET